MKLKNILSISAVTAALLITGCSSVQTPSSDKNDFALQQEVKLQAKEAIMTVGGSLKKNMVSKMKEGGASNAALFCSDSASEVAKEAAKTLPKGVSVKRITAKPRNINNKATKEQLEVLNQLESMMKDGNMPEMMVKKISSSHYQVYKPVKVDGKCLTCHGSEKMRNKEAYDIIASKYPSDKAVDYNAGDFRGAFLVDIIK